MVMHLAAVARQAGAQHGFGDESGVGGNLDHRIQVDATEHDAGIDRGRTQREIDLLAAVQADAGGADHVLEGALLEHRVGSSEQVADRAMPLAVNSASPAGIDANAGAKISTWQC